MKYDSQNQMSLTPEQCRAARALLNWSQTDLANASGTARATVADFERSERQPYSSSLASLREALETAGVEFIARNGGGVGVRLRE